MLPSDYEGFGLVLLEAMANFCIPIVTHYPGVEEVIHNQKNGIILYDKGSDFLTKEIASLLERYHDVFQYMRHSMIKTLEMYDFQTYIRKFETLYNSLIVAGKD